MHGIINLAIKKFIIDKYGINTWEQILESGKIDHQQVWAEKEYYNDEISRIMLEEVSFLCKVPKSEIDEQFGAYLLQHLRNLGYDSLLKSLGVSIRDWISRLNILHQHIEYTLPKLISPEFWVTDSSPKSDSTFILCYKSCRGACWSNMAKGMLREACKVYFISEMLFDTIQMQEENGAEYSSWNITIVSSKESTNQISFEEKIKQSIQCPFSNIQISSTTTDNPSVNIDKNSNNKLLPSTSNIGLSSTQLNNMFPFHIIFDNKFNIIQCGTLLLDFLPFVSDVSKIDALFSVTTSPYLWNWDVFINMPSCFELRIRSIENSSKSDHPLNLVGNVSFSDDMKVAYYLCAPAARNLKDMCAEGITMSDYHGQNARLELVLQSENLANEAEETNRLKHLSQQLEAERECSVKLMEEVTKTSSEALSVKKMFVRYVSHEIRTPLTVSSIGMSLIHDEILKIEGMSKVAEQVVQCKDSIDIAVCILNDLLSYEKLESGILQLNRKPHKAQFFILNAIKPFVLQGQEKNVKIQVHSTVPDFGTAYIDIDSNKMSQVIRNFVSNAIKFSSKGSTVNIHITWMSERPSMIALDEGVEHESESQSESTTTLLSSKDITIRIASSNIFSKGESSANFNDLLEPMGYLMIEFTDSGVGIAKSDQKRVFNDIVQFNPDELQAGGGSGLGLWISKKIVDLHNGRVGLKSQGVGYGSTFYLELPMYHMKQAFSENLENDGEDVEIPKLNNGNTYKLHEISENTTNVRPPYLDSEQLSYFSSKRVLIVDDAKMIRVLMTRILERKGAMCIQAEDGLDAIKCVKDAIARNQIFEVILMDFIMPHMDGPTATSMIRELGYRGLIIGITGNMMPEDVRHFLDHGANTVFPKPIHFEDLDVYLSETAADNKTLRDL